MTTPAKLFNAVRAVPALDALSDDELSELLTTARPRSYRRRQLLFERGDVGDSLVVVVSGRVKVTTRSADGGELLLTWVGEGETLGELSVLDGGTRSADVEVVDDATVVYIDRQAVLAMMHTNSGFAESVWGAVAASVRRLTEVAADLVFLDVPRRIAKWLIEQSPERQGDVVVSQEEIGAHVGATRQSVNLALRGFERRGWVTLGRSRITLVDRDALVRLAAD